ncbi:MAG: YdcF family protein, partial [Rhodoferax sp.]|nr:YdcF family protein [Rhodoferax sp.]
LESRYPALPANTDMQKFVGVVVLGGALTNSRIWEVHHQVALNDQAERMTATVGLLHKHPHLMALFTGGIASVPPEGLTEAQRARQFFDEMGVDPKRLLYEDRSRNTAENATLSATVASVNPQQPWLLLTSANHMPRSIGVFRKAGWNVTPYPVDYRNDGTLDWLDFSLDDGPRDWRLVLHELVGYYVYRWRGSL